MKLQKATMERLRAARFLLRYSSKSFSAPRSSPSSAEHSIHRSAGAGLGQWRLCSEPQQRRFGGIAWAPLGEPGRIQSRCFGSVATEVRRDSSFATLNSDDVSFFKGVLGEKNVIQEEDRLEFANTDWMRKYKGSSKLLLQPRTTEEVMFLSGSLLLIITPCFTFSSTQKWSITGNLILV